MRNLGGEVDGVLQQYRIFNAEQLVRAPNHLSYEELACWPCAGVSVWNALFNSSVPIGGKNVVFQGTGGVSMLGLILANAVGAKVSLRSGKPGISNLTRPDPTDYHHVKLRREAGGMCFSCG